MSLVTDQITGIAEKQSQSKFKMVLSYEVKINYCGSMSEQYPVRQSRESWRPEGPIWIKRIYVGKFAYVYNIVTNRAKQQGGLDGLITVLSQGIVFSYIGWLDLSQCPSTLLLFQGWFVIHVNLISGNIGKYQCSPCDLNAPKWT